MSFQSEEFDCLKLSDAPAGKKLRVFRLHGMEATCQRLREMGFCETAEVKIVQKSGAVICQVCGSRVCLNPQMAGSILVKEG
ncbi:MAG: ferrous iron transport protein A [Verrucomicrobiales bacterium]|nr:ferrous iron transport protein A [Verrucomicrobiales bacterium]